MNENQARVLLVILLLLILLAGSLVAQRASSGLSNAVGIGAGYTNSDGMESTSLEIDIKTGMFFCRNWHLFLELDREVIEEQTSVLIGPGVLYEIRGKNTPYFVVPTWLSYGWNKVNERVMHSFSGGFALTLDVDIRKLLRSTLLVGPAFNFGGTWNGKENFRLDVGVLILWKTPFREKENR